MGISNPDRLIYLN